MYGVSPTAAAGTANEETSTKKNPGAIFADALPTSVPKSSEYSSLKFQTKLEKFATVKSDLRADTPAVTS